MARYGGSEVQNHPWLDKEFDKGQPKLHENLSLNKSINHYHTVFEDQHEQGLFLGIKRIVMLSLTSANII